MNAQVKPNLEITVALMKAEILNDIARGKVPRTVETFSELHDYVDANEYGGFCDDKIADKLIEAFGGRDADEGMPSGFIEFMNAAQGAIDVWLRDTHMNEVRGTIRRVPIDTCKRVYVQTRLAESQQEWADSMGTVNVKQAVEFAAHQRVRGLLARVVVRSEFVIA